MQSNDPDSKEEIRVYKHNQERREVLINKLWRQAAHEDELYPYDGKAEKVLIHYSNLPKE